MHRPSTRILAGHAIAVLMLGGCKQYESPNSQSSVPTTTGTPAPTAPAAVPDQPSRTGADLGVADSAAHGRYLVDATGKTLYMLSKDGRDSSSCADACTTQWPPLLSPAATPRALDPAIAQDAIVTIQRPDGGMQVTYRGHPLYHYSRDTAAGQVNGHGVKDQFGEWNLVSATGSPIR
jgi:predicted lipoprotein with Yx(FWY)xxD motif